jgi:uncharacterized protein (TIGR01777 family)
VLRILISGASGLIGKATVRALEGRGDSVCRLVRRLPEGANEVQWDPMREIPPELVSGYDVVIHLSGENVAGLWTENKKRRIYRSRVVSTSNLAQALARTEKPPTTFLCASAIGYYGDRGDEILTEESASGSGFLAEVCREWEAATEAASQAGIRVVNLRFGIVLSRNGGALKQMLLPFRLGLGGRIGSGRQWWSWIHIEDVVRLILPIVSDSAGRGRPAPHSQISGPVNVVAPNPATNAEFTRALAAVLKRPAVLTVPRIAVKLALREFAEEGLLASARVMPKKLLESGFAFRYPDLKAALADLLK